MHIERQAAARLKQLLATFPAVLICGPRQCGKSTLVRSRLATFRHIDLERPADAALLAADLEGFLDANPKRLAVDEAQRAPELFPALRHAIDRGRGNGRFVLLGSASPTLMQTASETLAGRMGVMELTPFTNEELAGTRHAADRWYWGGFPRVHALRGATKRIDWLDGYVTTFLERELPMLGVGLPARRLRTLWMMLTHVHGNLLNVSDLARSIGVSSHTIQGDLDVLEATFMIRRLQPFFANIQKRLTKSPKLYVRDTGVLHLLAGLRAPGELETWPKRGSSFEGLVIEEIIALASIRLRRPEFYFWRTQAGAEVDLLIVQGGVVVPIEIKLGASVDRHAVVGLRQCMSDLGARRGFVVYGGTERTSLGKDIELVPFAQLSTAPFLKPSGRA
jgi:predicted AAA+ superfamily ATPase